MKDELGERMKSQYENRTRFSLPRRTYTIIRLDGKAFHTYTKGLEKPFDKGLREDIDNAIIAMLPHIQGAVFAYTQSDEISVLMTDFATPTTNAWFDGNIQKISSVSASIITAHFNQLRKNRQVVYALKNEIDFSTSDVYPLAYFDSRVFTIPDPTEVMNYIIWRGNDCSRNSISMIAQNTFSHKELHGKSTSNMLNMLRVAGKPIESFSDSERYGRIIFKESYVLKCKSIELGGKLYDASAPRTRWTSIPAWKFTDNTYKLMNMIPKYE